VQKPQRLWWLSWRERPSFLYSTLMPARDTRAPTGCRWKGGREELMAGCRWKGGREELMAGCGWEGGREEDLMAGCR